jgi:hypothetical protein
MTALGRSVDDHVLGLPLLRRAYRWDCPELNKESLFCNVFLDVAARGISQVRHDPRCRCGVPDPVVGILDDLAEVVRSPGVLPPRPHPRRRATEQGLPGVVGLLRDTTIVSSSPERSAPGSSMLSPASLSSRFTSGGLRPRVPS